MANAFLDPVSLAYCLVLGIALTLVPFSIFVWGATRIPASTVSILGVLEAVSAGVVGFVFFGEEITLINLAGMALVLGSIVLMNLHICRKIEERKQNDGASDSEDD